MEDLNDIADPDYDYLDPYYTAPIGGNGENDHDDDMKKLGSEISDYILGTLMVRVVAGRNLNDRSVAGTVSPYASIKFGKQTQRTSEVYESSDPIWPRGETSFLDVSLPMHQVTHAASGDDLALLGLDTEMFDPVLTIAVFHSSGMSKQQKKLIPVKKMPPMDGKNHGDSDDQFLGMLEINCTQLLTGKRAHLDSWYSLSGVGSNQRVGSLRIVCEYEPSDPPPRKGDLVRFTRFCHPKDLYPVPVEKAYRVQEVVDDQESIVLSYETQEGWICSFMCHRFMVICEERYHGAIEYYQDELALRKERFEQSVVMAEVKKTMMKVPEEGLLSVGAVAVQGGVSLLGRWWHHGLETAVDDIVRTTNWNGDNQVEQQDSDVENDDDDTMEDSKFPAQNENDDDTDAIPGMPACPITGFPMKDPVVAADGHTYERTAIARWLQTSDKSPLTGALLIHKELVPNYMLLSSLEQQQKQDASSDGKVLRVDSVAKAAPESTTEVASSGIDIGTEGARTENNPENELSSSAHA